MVADGMTEFDGMVGQLLKKLDDLGIADNTIVVWTTDNGAEVFSWPDGGTTPFKGEKNTNWEGGYRVPCVMRWPGVIKPGTEINHITSHEDFVPTLVAAAGEPNVKEKLLTGYEAAGKTSRSISMVTTSATCSRAPAPASARNISTGPMTAISPACATTAGSSSSWNNAPRGSMCGRTR